MADPQFEDEKIKVVRKGAFVHVQLGSRGELRMTDEQAVTFMIAIAAAVNGYAIVQTPMA